MDVGIFFPLYLFLAVLVLCCCAWIFSSCGEWGPLSSCSAWASHRRDLLQHTGSWVCRLSSLVAPQHGETSCVPCTGRQILNHWTARDVPFPSFFTEAFNSRSEFLSFRTIDTWGWVIFWGGVCLVCLRMFSSNPGLFLWDARSILPPKNTVQKPEAL